MIRVAILLTFFAPCAWAEDILRPTEKELATLASETSLSPLREKLAKRFDNRLIQIKVYCSYKTLNVEYFDRRFGGAKGWAISPDGHDIIIHWADGTAKIQEDLKAKGRTVTIQGRVEVSNNWLSLTDVVVKP